jgi:hypothetical protein
MKELTRKQKNEMLEGLPGWDKFCEQGDLEDRARKAYYRRFGNHAPIPSVDFYEEEGAIELHNVNGHLATYKIATGKDGSVRLRYRKTPVVTGC